MSNEQLAVLAKDGDQGAALELWEQVEKLLYKLMARLYHKNPDSTRKAGVVLEDLLQENYLAMLGAVNDYSPDKGLKFTSYLRYHVQSRFSFAVGNRTAKVLPLNESMSLNAPFPGDEEKRERGDLLPDPAAEEEMEEVIHRLYCESLVRPLGEAVDSLPESQREVIREHYYGGKPISVVAREKGCGTGELRREKAKAFNALRRKKAVQDIRREEFNTIQRYGYGVGLSRWKTTWTSSTELAAEHLNRLR